MADATTNFLGTLVRNMFDRIIRGEYDYDQDLRMLQKHGEKAKSIGAPRLQADVVNTIAVMNAFSGRYEEAIEQFNETYELHEALGNQDGMANALNNLGKLQGVMGRYEQGLSYYNRGLEIAQRFLAAGNPSPVGSHGLIITGRMDMLLMLRRWKEAEACFDDLRIVSEQLINMNKAVYARVMVHAYRGMADLALREKRTDDARAHLALALNFAQGLNLQFEQADIYFGQAHIHLTENNAAEAEVCWQEAEAIFSGLHSPATIGSIYMREARWLMNNGYTQHAQAYANKALMLYRAHDMPQLETVAQALVTPT